MISFKRVKQETGSYCGPAVMEMLLAALSIKVSQKQIVAACRAEETVMKYGMPLSNLATGVKSLHPEVTVWMKERASVKDLEEVTKAGYVVGINWQGIFAKDEYGDDEWDRVQEMKDKLMKVPKLKGSQGHYMTALEVNLEKGYLRFADPYGHYSKFDRFVAIKEFEERWWDDRLDRSKKGEKMYILVKRLMFVVTGKDDRQMEKWGMVEI